VDKIPRHQCLIYSGSRTRQLAALAGALVAHLKANYRCLYLNAPEMIEGMRAYLTSAGINVTEEIFKKRLILSCDQSHLREGVFDHHFMIEQIKSMCAQSVADGHAGLWASGDMGWEIGPAQDFSKLVEYERALEGVFASHPMLRGVCQYHVDMLPPGVPEIGAMTHPARFVTETLSTSASCASDCCQPR
jgi:hypothetical protein